MKTQEEIQQAHDILLAVLLGEVHVEIPIVSRHALHAAADALCWTLGCKHNHAFENNLRQLTKLAAQRGQLLTRRLPGHRAIARPATPENT